MMTHESRLIHITDGKSELSLEIHYRSYPDSDYWDGNFVVTRIRANSSGFRADFTESLHLSELQGLRDNLRQMYSTLKGRAELKALDGFIELEARMDRLGHIQWLVALTYPAGFGARLLFELENDQTYLSEILRQLNAVLEGYPIIG